MDERLKQTHYSLETMGQKTKKRNKRNFSKNNKYNFFFI